MSDTKDSKPKKGSTLLHSRAELLALKEGLQLRVRTPKEDKFYRVPEGGLSLGRDESCDVVLPYPHVSANHARVERRNERFWVVDQDSSHGTFLNDWRIREAELVPGALVQLTREPGVNVSLTLEVPAKAGALPADFHGMVGRTPAMRTLFEMIDRVAPSRLPVLILGETGAGKEGVARALHERSSRKDKPFMAINCADLVKDLAGSELFGHEKGAFTGAIASRMGKLEAANGGTLFLDELGEMAPDVQGKLLRAIEQGVIERVGSNKQVRVDVRYVCATHRDMDEAVRLGAFRKDLFYRLTGFVLRIPPLRERMEDLEPLVEFFMKRGEVAGERVRRLSDAAWVKLKGFDYPGNVRQLELLIKATWLEKAPAPVVQPEEIVLPMADLPDELVPASKQEEEDDRHGVINIDGLSLVEIERKAILFNLRKHRGHRGRTHEVLGISKSTLATRIKELKIGLEEGDDLPKGTGRNLPQKDKR